MAKTLKDKTINGLYWTAIERFSIQFIQLVVNILLARILLPEDYGVIGILAVFLAVANVLVDCGFGSSLIQNKDRNNTDYSTAFYFNAIVGIVLYLLLYASSGAIANFYELPILEDVVKVYSLALVFNSLQVVHIAKLTIEFSFKSQAIISLGTQLVASSTALYMAYTGWGVWALVFHNLVAVFLKTVFIWIYCKWIPAFIFSMQSFKTMFNYGYKIVISAVINAVYSNVHSIIIGKRFSIPEVGFYNRGNQFPSMLTTSLMGILMKVCFPVMSDIQDDNEKLGRAYRKFLLLPMFIMFPALFLLCILAEPMILLLLGEKWLPCVPFLQIMCIGCMFDPLTHINLNILYVKGRTDLVLKLEFIKKTIAFAIILISMQFGIYWLCIGQSFYCLVAYFFNCHYTKTYINFGFVDQMKLLMPLFFKSMTLALLCYGFYFVIDHALLQILVITVVYSSSFLILNYLTKEACLMEYVEIIRTKLPFRKL